MRNIICSMLTMAAILLPLYSLPAQVPVSGSNLTGYRSTASSQIGPSWLSYFGGFKISWDISSNPSNASHPWHYIYHITDAKGGSLASNLTNFLLETASGASLANFDFSITDPNVIGIQTYSTYEGSIFAVKFTNLTGGTTTIEFLSNLAPTWGDFYTEGQMIYGYTPYAYNVGFGTEPSAGGPYGAWIPTPGTFSSVAVPEPSTYLILGCAIAIAILFQRRKFYKTMIH